MKVWVIRLMSTEDSFRIRPLLRTAGIALREAESGGAWGTAAIVGYYARAYKERYRVRLGLTQDMVRCVADDLGIVVQRVGVETARRAIDTVFGKRLEWVSDHHSFLANKNNFTRFVVPHLDNRSHVEWSGDRQEAGAEDTKL